MPSRPGTRTEKPLTVTVWTWLHAWKETGSRPRSPPPEVQGFVHQWGTRQLPAAGATVTAGGLRDLEGQAEDSTPISQSGPSRCGCDMDPVRCKRGRQEQRRMALTLNF